MALIAGIRTAFLLGSLTLLGAAGPDSGWQAYTDGRPAEAVAIWTEAATKGDADAEFGLGVAYDLGEGVGQDAAKACLWYRRAGDAGVPAAAFDIAVMLDQGRCGPRDATRVADWYGRAAAYGHARAEYDLAQLYEAGDGVPQNSDQAAGWYRLAAAHGLVAAGEKAAALARVRPKTADIQAVLPATPLDGTIPDRGQPVPFVWFVPAQPGPVHFFLEVFALAPEGAHNVIARYVDQSATLVTLEPGTAQYAWRVTTVAPEAQRYVASPWSRFQITGRTAQ